MAVKHVKDYYLKIEKMYVELLADLKEMEEDFKKGECTEEELQNLLIPVNNIKENYERLAYILYLLYLPNRDKKKGRYEKENKLLLNHFKEKGITMRQELEKDKDALKIFKQSLKEKFKKDE